jgi:hypothetical protein
MAGLTALSALILSAAPMIEGGRVQDISTVPQRPREQKATVYVYRPRPSVGEEGGGLKLPVSMDGVRLGRVAAGKYFVARVEPGPHSFRSERQAPVRADFEAGQEHFLRVEVVPDIPRARGVLRLVDPEEGTAAIAGLIPLEDDEIEDRLVVASGARFPFQPTAWQGGESRPSAGVEVGRLPAELRDSLGPSFRGVLVQRVRVPGPGAFADLRPGDVIQTLDGAEVTSAFDFRRSIRARAAGDSVRLGLWRDGERLELALLLEDHLKLAQEGCEAGAPEWCSDLGVFHGFGVGGVPRDETRGFGLFERACEAGFAPACSQMAWAIEWGWAGRRDSARAAALYQRACDGGVVLSCYVIGLAYEEGQGVDRDLARAAELYQLACDGGEGLGCRGVGHLFETGGGVPADAARAARLYEQGCAYEEPYACASLGLLYERGKGVPKDTARAAALYELGCRAPLPGRPTEGDTWVCPERVQFWAAR